LGGRKGIRPVNNGGMVEVGTGWSGWSDAQPGSQYLHLPLHHKVQKFSSGTSSPGWSWKKGRKTVVVCWWWLVTYGDSDVQ